MKSLLSTQAPKEEFVLFKKSVPDIIAETEYVMTLFHYFLEYIDEAEIGNSIENLKYNGEDIRYIHILDFVTAPDRKAHEVIARNYQKRILDNHITFTHGDYDYTYLIEDCSTRTRLFSHGASNEFYHRNRYIYKLYRVRAPEEDIEVLSRDKITQYRLERNQVVEALLTANRSNYNQAHNLLMAKTSELLIEAIKVKPTASTYSCVVSIPELPEIINPHYLAIHSEQLNDNTLIVTYDEMYDHFVVDIDL